MSWFSSPSLKQPAVWSLLPPFLWSSLLILILPSFMAEKTPFPALTEETVRERGHGSAFTSRSTFFVLIFVPLSDQTKQPSFHLCNPNRLYITDICVTRQDIQFHRNYQPYPIAATSPSAVQTLNHKTRVSSVPALILTGSNISVPTKSFWCLQQNNKWGS